jgi:hypothetical protein
MDDWMSHSAHYIRPPGNVEFHLHSQIQEAKVKMGRCVWGPLNSNLNRTIVLQPTQITSHIVDADAEWTLHLNLDLEFLFLLIGAATAYCILRSRFLSRFREF